MSQKATIQVIIELGHKAVYRSTPTPEGFTHDWCLFVRGTNKNDISHFVERTVFHLHESFAKPVRVIKSAPYEVNEKGYGSFECFIDVHFKNKNEPRKVSFKHDLVLPMDRPGELSVVARCEKLIFRNPNEDFASKLLKAGGIYIGDGTPHSPKSKSSHERSKSAGKSSEHKSSSVAPVANKPSAAAAPAAAAAAAAAAATVPRRPPSSLNVSAGKGGKNSPSTAAVSSSTGKIAEKTITTPQTPESRQFTELFGPPIDLKADATHKHKKKKSKESSGSATTTTTAAVGAVVSSHSTSSRDSTPKDSVPVTDPVSDRQKRSESQPDHLTQKRMLEESLFGGDTDSPPRKQSKTKDKEDTGNTKHTENKDKSKSDKNKHEKRNDETKSKQKPSTNESATSHRSTSKTPEPSRKLSESQSSKQSQQQSHHRTTSSSSSSHHHKSSSHHHSSSKHKSSSTTTSTVKPQSTSVTKPDVTPQKTLQSPVKTAGSSGSSNSGNKSAKKPDITVSASVDIQKLFGDSSGDDDSDDDSDYAVKSKPTVAPVPTVTPVPIAVPAVLPSIVSASKPDYKASDKHRKDRHKSHSHRDKEQQQQVKERDTQRKTAEELVARDKDFSEVHQAATTTTTTTKATKQQQHLSTKLKTESKSPQTSQSPPIVTAIKIKALVRDIPKPAVPAAVETTADSDDGELVSDVEEAAAASSSSSSVDSSESSASSDNEQDQQQQQSSVEPAADIYDDMDVSDSEDDEVDVCESSSGVKDELLDMTAAVTAAAAAADNYQPSQTVSNGIDTIKTDAAIKTELTDDTHSAPQGVNNTDLKAANGLSLNVLLELQEQLMLVNEDNQLEQLTVLIEETGRYSVTDTFNFDLCTLDLQTIDKLQNFLRLHRHT